MLGFLKSLVGRSGRRNIQSTFYPFDRRAFQIGPIPLGDNAFGFGAVGSSAWFNPRSPYDSELLLSEPSQLMETDSLEVLSKAGEPEYRGQSEFVLYQPWREPNNNGARMLGAMNSSMANQIGRAVKGSPIRNFFLISGGFSRGSVSALDKALGGHQLETLGLFWFFSGDDITDDPFIIEEITALCRNSKVQKLSLLTAVMNSKSESLLIEGLAAAPSVKQCAVFEKDDKANYRPFELLALDEFLKNRN